MLPAGSRSVPASCFIQGLTAPMGQRYAIMLTGPPASLLLAALTLPTMPPEQTQHSTGSCANEQDQQAQHQASCGQQNASHVEAAAHQPGVLLHLHVQAAALPAYSLHHLQAYVCVCVCVCVRSQQALAPSSKHPWLEPGQTRSLRSCIHADRLAEALSAAAAEAFGTCTNKAAQCAHAFMLTLCQTASFNTAVAQRLCNARTRAHVSSLLSRRAAMRTHEL